jgi:hypothetical protein
MVVNFSEFHYTKLVQIQMKNKLSVLLILSIWALNSYVQHAKKVLLTGVDGKRSDEL